MILLATDYVNYNDEAPTPRADYDQSKVPAEIRERASYVRHKIYGQNVREALAQNAEIAGLIALGSENLSQTANEISLDIKNRYDNQIANSQLDNEVVDARLPENEENAFPNLRERLNSSDHKISQNEKLLKVGRINLPYDFPKLPFDVFKKGEYQFDHTFNPRHVHDWSNATEVFISDVSSGASELGSSKDKPINIVQFILRYKEGKYGSKKDFIITFVDEVYGFQWTSSDRFSDIDVNIYFRSSSQSGKTTIGFLRGGEVWTNEEGNVYKYTAPSSNALDYPVNLTQLDPYDVPLPYHQVKTLNECTATEGSYYLDVNSSDIYLHKHSHENINFVKIARRLQVLPVRANNSTMIFEDLLFLENADAFDSKNINSKFYFTKCQFYRGMQDAFAMTGEYSIYLLDCVSAYASKDGFNYHATNEDSLAVEVNCISYGNGKYKFIGGNTTTGSNNGSTAHDGIHMLRIGSKYSECEGPVSADIQNCYSISIGCESYDILDTTTGLRAGFYVQNETGTTEEKPKYIIECRQSGDYFEEGILAVNSSETYYQNFRGHKNVDGTEISWEGALN